MGLTQGNFRHFLTLIEMELTDRQYAGAYTRMYNQHQDIADVLAVQEDEIDEGIFHECGPGANVYSEEGAIEDYCWEMMEDTGQLATIPENLRPYFDMKQYAHDMSLNGVSAFEFNGTWYVVQ